MTGKEAIEKVGFLTSKDFSIESPSLENAYKAVFSLFSEGMDRRVRRKGVMAIGGVGCGKTTCMKIMHRLFRDSQSRFLLKRASDIRDLVSDISLIEIKKELGYGLKCDLYIDDLGVGGGESKHYGNSISILGEIILDRYELWVNEGYLTHLSSNLVAESKDKNITTLRTLFGDRVCDRLIEMTMPIVFTNKSLRK